MVGNNPPPQKGEDFVAGFVECPPSWNKCSIVVFCPPPPPMQTTCLWVVCTVLTSTVNNVLLLFYFLALQICGPWNADSTTKIFHNTMYNTKIRKCIHYEESYFRMKICCPLSQYHLACSVLRSLHRFFFSCKSLDCLLYISLRKQIFFKIDFVPKTEIIICK